MVNEVQKKTKDKLNALKTMLTSDKVKNAIYTALPKYLTTDKMIGVALSEVRNTPKLLECDQTSFINALVQCSQLGLLPGNGLGQAYLIPYGKECTFMPGYRGYIVAARRSTPKTIITAHCVYENDEKYECIYGSVEKIIHIPTLKNRGAIIGAYAIARDEDGNEIIDQLSVEDINKARACSKCPDAAWKLWYPEQARKTAVRRLSKYLDLSPQFNKLRDIDNDIDFGKNSVIEGDYETEPEKKRLPQNKSALNKLKKNAALREEEDSIYGD